MQGKLEYNKKGQRMCDKCGKVPIYSSAKLSNAMRDYIGTPFSKRKVWYLCLTCTIEFSKEHRW